MNVLENSARTIHVSCRIAGAILSAAALLCTRAASAQCLDPPPTTILESLVASGTGDNNSTIGMDAQGRFAIAYQRTTGPPYLCDPDGIGIEVVVRSYCQDGDPVADAISVIAPCQESLITFASPSIALNPSGVALVGVIGSQFDNYHLRLWPTAYFTTMNFGQEPSAPIVIPSYVPGQDPDWYTTQFDFGPSVGISTTQLMGTWDRGDTLHTSIEGIPLGVSFDEDDWVGLVKQCGVSDYCQHFVYQPCMAMRTSDGYFAVAYALSEAPYEDPPWFNIALKVYDPNGIVVAELTGPDRNDPNQWVNNPSLEDATVDDETRQVSPSASFAG